MEEYTGLVELGIIVALILIVGLVLRLLGIRYSSRPGAKKKGRSKAGRQSQAKTGKEQYYEQDAYVDDGDGKTQWKDDDMYTLKERKKEKKGDDYESWDDY